MENVVPNETSSETVSGFPHILSEEERDKGRRTVTEKKRKANARNPLKTGKYAKTFSGDFLQCNTCSFQRICQFAERDSQCKVVGINEFRKISDLWNVGAADFLKEIMQVLMELKVSTHLSGNSAKGLGAYLESLLKIYELRFGDQPKVEPQQKAFVVRWKPPSWNEDSVTIWNSEKIAIEKSVEKQWLEKRIELHQEMINLSKKRLEQLNSTA